MRNKVILCFSVLLLIVSMFGFSSCSRLFAPSDQEVIKAINESGVFKGLALQSPMVILEKGGRSQDGTWPVKVKVVFTYEIANGKTSAPVEKIITFKMFKVKDSKGQETWKAKI